ncbi:MAG: hypothetical protein JKY09_05740 [Crocinitomicaceae bacterium]|nr:hypothetical protein [Crocinitomicaceae bacterium]
MKKSFLVFLISLIGQGVFGQQYRTSIGIKGDWSNLNADLAEFSVKHFFASPSAVEVNFGAGRRFVWLEGMYHRNITFKKDVDWYLGGGVDLGYWNTNYDRRYDKSTHSGFWGGTTGVLGLEYTFNFIPINLALDAGPTLRLIPDLEVGLKVGFACRYAIR